MPADRAALQARLRSFEQQRHGLAKQQDEQQAVLEVGGSWQPSRGVMLATP